ALAPFVLPEQRLATNHVDEAAFLRGAVAHHEHLLIGQLRELAGGRLTADEVDDRDLIERKGQILRIVLREIQVAVDEVFALIAVEGNDAALAFAAGENKSRALRRDKG